MAKKIKFNLICDDMPIRTIEDLQNNFSVEDVLEYYNNGLLHRWLEVRGFSKELDAVKEITENEPIEIIKALIHIFDISADESEIEKSLYIFKYLQERQELCANYEKQNYHTEKIIDDYIKGFNKLRNQILGNPDNAAMIKAAIAEMSKHYGQLFAMNHRKLFYELVDASPLAVMCLLMKEETRGYYLPDDIDDTEESIAEESPFAQTENTDKKCMYYEICSLIKDSKFLKNLDDNLKRFSGETDHYWKDLEVKETKCMIISMESGDFVRSLGVKDENLNDEAVNGKFVILDGIDYKSNSAEHELLYMEV